MTLARIRKFVFTEKIESFFWLYRIYMLLVSFWFDKKICDSLAKYVTGEFSIKNNSNPNNIILT